MDQRELEYWRVNAACQELFGATDDEVAAEKPVKDAIDAFSRLVCKWRSEKQLKAKLEMRATLLKEIGVPMIGKKK
jgi:hypothetical protein